MCHEKMNGDEVKKRTLNDGDANRAEREMVTGN
jgi:hypothetical protein